MKFMILANIDELCQVKKMKAVDIFVSKALCPLAILTVCKRLKKHAFVYDRNMNARNINIQGFFLQYDLYKHFPSYLGNCLGFDLQTDDAKEIEKVSSILGSLDNKKCSYAKYESGYFSLPQQISVANIFGTCYEVCDMLDICTALQCGAKGFEFSKSFIGNINKAVKFLKSIEAFYFLAIPTKLSISYVEGEVDCQHFENGLMLFAREDCVVRVQFLGKREIALYTMKKTKRYFLDEIEFSLKKNYPAVISLL